MRQEVAGTTPEAEASLTLTERVAAARAALAENSERMAAAAERLRAHPVLARQRAEPAGAAARVGLRPAAGQARDHARDRAAKGILIAQTGCTPEEAFD